MIGLRIGGVPEHFNLPWRLAIEEGRFRQAGIDLHWSDMGGGTGQMIRGLETGTLDVAVLLTEGITKAILEGLKARIVQVYVVTPLHWGIHVPFHSEIKTVDQLKGQTFAISREGSGSHLMTYVKASQEGWDTTNLKFNVVGDIYGGLWALQNDEAQAFLWEKYTTFPFTEQGKCRYIDEVVTPWPCFVIAVRNEIVEQNPETIELILEIINTTTEEFKDIPSINRTLANRFNQKTEDIDAWLLQTKWSQKNITEETLNKIQNQLFELSLIDKKSTFAEIVHRF